MNHVCREALEIFSSGIKSNGGFASLRTRMQQSMALCDRSTDCGQLDHGAILIFLCAIDDLEAHEKSNDVDLRTNLFMSAVRKLRSAEIQYDKF